MKHGTCIIILAIITVLTGCVSQVPWRNIQAIPVCRHKVAAWVEAAKGIDARQINYVTEEGYPHAVVEVTHEDGSVTYLDVKDTGYATSIKLSEREKKSIFWRNKRYNNGMLIQIITK